MAIITWALEESCTCSSCNEARFQLEQLRAVAPTGNIAEATAAPAPAIELTLREQRRAQFAERGITPIPDDEVTDKGDYVIWNKYDPTCTLIVSSPEDICAYYNTLETLASWGQADDVVALKHRAHLEKPVRIVGWFSVAGRPTHFYVRLGRQWMDDYSRGYRDANYTTSKVDRSDRTVPMAPRDLPRNARAAYTERLISGLHDRDVIGGAAFERHHALRQALFGGPPWAGAFYRGKGMSGLSYKLAHTTLKEIGRMISRAETEDWDDLVREVNELPAILRPQVQPRIVDAWNQRSLDTLMVASCGHVEHEDNTHTVRNDRTVCDECFEDDYVYVEDIGEHDQRDNVYRHDDDCYYTYERDYDDDDDDDRDNDSESSVGGRIQNYTTNVLGYHKADTSITVSPYGEVLMGIELEVVPERRARADTATATTDELCQGYAILKNDGSLDDGGFEIVTAPRGLKEHIERFSAWTPHKQLRAWDADCCGMHVHLSSQAFSQSTLGKFIEFINAKENDDLIIAIAGRHAKQGGNAATYCQREGVLQNGNPKKNVQGKSTERYRMINTQNLGYLEAERLGVQYVDGKGINTVELRIFRATLKKSRLLAQIEFAHAAVMFCRWSSMRELRQEHFLSWLRKTAGTYPHLAKWFGVKANTMVVVAAPPVREEAEV